MTRTKSCEIAAEIMRFVRSAQGMTHDDRAWFIDRIEPIIAKSIVAERDRCVNQLYVSRADASLAAGELTAQEWRTISAVLTWMQTRIRGEA